MLVLALYPEGSTDARFLPPIIRRTAERIITQHGQDIVDVSEPMIVPRQQDQRREHYRRRHLDFSTRQEPLARKIDLDTLYFVPSYREFFINFKRTLAELNFISCNYSEE